MSGRAAESFSTVRRIKLNTIATLFEQSGC
jgi:hypothetical protein